YYKYRQYHTKSKGAQEAHEAIRPTYIAHAEISGTAQEKKLYDLIRKRTIACQMADAELERTTISIGISGLNEKFVATGEVITFDGFLQVYKESSDEGNDNEEENGILPAVHINDNLQMESIVSTERFTQRPARYTEASLVRRLEELGIGRPSTYAPTIQTIQNRQYIVKGDKDGVERSYHVVTLNGKGLEEQVKTEIAGADRNKLLPTDIGIVVNDFLMKYFQLVMDYNFTAKVEKEFDSIAEGGEVWTSVIDQFYKVFHPIVDEANSIHTEYKVGERLLGTDPKSGKPIFVKIGRYGPMAQIGDSDPENKNGEKPQFATLQKGQSIETITLEEALRLFDLPRTLGEYEGKVVVAAIGRFGPFIRHNGKFVSIPKTYNPYSITLDEAVQLIQDKRKKDEERLIKKFDEEPELQILNGRFGPYIAYKGNNYKIPKAGYEPTAMTLDDCLKLIQESAEKPATKKRTARKKA
ncbi:MAG TPA: DNA topoisomerase I, partial [Parabacteroides sp.]|nr:DNA topoisomerase I [Parabacteroides sp.]